MNFIETSEQVVNVAIKRYYPQFDKYTFIRRPAPNFTSNSQCIASVSCKQFPIVSHVHVNTEFQLIEYCTELADVREEVDYGVVAILMSEPYYTNKRMKQMFRRSPKPIFSMSLN